MVWVYGSYLSMSKGGGGQQTNRTAVSDLGSSFSFFLFCEMHIIGTEGCYIERILSRGHETPCITHVVHWGKGGGGKNACWSTIVFPVSEEKKKKGKKKNSRIIIEPECGDTGERHFILFFTKTIILRKGVFTRLTQKTFKIK